MIPRYITDRAALFEGDSAELRRVLRPNSVASMVTDPPSGIGFMGKAWDRDKGGRDQWIAWLAGIMRAAYEALMPGAHGLVWALPRTSHWTGIALEDAGFEHRGRVSHLFGTGFPKSLDLARQIDMHLCTLPGRHYDKHLPPAARLREGDHLCPEHPRRAAGVGWGTALKEGLEDWHLVRKPLEGTCVETFLRYGTGALNIDGCRIGESGGTRSAPGAEPNNLNAVYGAGMGGLKIDPDAQIGRWPANALLDDETAAALGAAAAYYYTPKPSRAEKDAGLDHLPVLSGGEATGRTEGDVGLGNPRAGAGRNGGGRNPHPTVKSIALMRYLVRMVTPPGGLVLDPFCGSGSTGVAALAEGSDFIGFEKNEDKAHGGHDYIPVIAGRLAHAEREYPRPPARLVA